MFYIPKIPPTTEFMSPPATAAVVSSIPPTPDEAMSRTDRAPIPAVPTAFMPAFMIAPNCGSGKGAAVIIAVDTDDVSNVSS